MHPILFQIGSFRIHTYGVFIALGFLTGIILALREAKRVGEEPENILDLSFYSIIAAIVGSRLLYIILNYRYYIENPLEMIKIWSGGLVYYGGFLLALIVGIWYIRKRHLPLWKTADIIAPSIAIGEAIGRLGCFSAGCCYGKETTLPWAITFYPTQLYSSITALFIFLILTVFKRFKKFDGLLIWLYVLLYSITRSIIEIFRGDDRGFLFEGTLSVSQFIGIILGITSVFMLGYLWRRNKMAS
ncbi:MAG: phosphatidylglycerol:prolipoprotein diacylglycerol transferase [bacterium]|nr:MAG: phosphatidylglycerol:prolipoprotein diacylglycerol transferase [bacterium]